MSDTTVSLTGTRIRVDSFYGFVGNNDEHIGKFATITSAHPDSDGDVQVTLDGHPGSVFYAHTWTVLGEGDTLPGAEPAAPTVEPTPAEARLERLITAIYQAAKDNGYQHHLADLFSEADIPLRNGERRLTLRGQRVVSPYSTTEVVEALDRLTIGEKPADAEVTVTRTIAEFQVSVPWPEVGEHTDCNDLNNALGDDWTQIPDDVLQKAALVVGLRGNAATLRDHLTNQRKIAANYGASVACFFCG